MQTVLTALQLLKHLRVTDNISECRLCSLTNLSTHSYRFTAVLADVCFRISGTPLRRLGSSRISAILARTPVPSPTASSVFNELENVDDEEPLLPDLCLQILWTEDVKRCTMSAASKVFVASDWLGKSCICWLLEDEKLLRCIDLKVTVSIGLLA